MPLKIEHCALIEENEWEIIFENIKKENINLAFILSLNYSGRDSDEKYIIKLVKQITTDLEIPLKEKVLLFKKLEKIWNYYLARKIIKREVFFAISELIKVIELKLQIQVQRS